MPASRIRETLIKWAFYGEPAQLCDAGMNKIKGLAPLILPQTFPHLFNQHFLSSTRHFEDLTPLDPGLRRDDSSRLEDSKIPTVIPAQAGIQRLS